MLVIQRPTVEAIGEAVKALSAEVLAAEPAVPWKAIARMRDQLTHRYFDTDHAIERVVEVRDRLDERAAVLLDLVDEVRRQPAASETLRNELPDGRRGVGRVLQCGGGWRHQPEAQAQREGRQPGRNHAVVLGNRMRSMLSELRAMRRERGLRHHDRDRRAARATGTRAPARTRVTGAMVTSGRVPGTMGR